MNEFSKKILKIQGKFKIQPKGIVYIGGEIQNKMNLGFIGNSLCNLLLRLIKAVVSKMHYSFGLYSHEINNNLIETNHDNNNNNIEFNPNELVENPQ